MSVTALLQHALEVHRTANFPLDAPDRERCLCCRQQLQEQIGQLQALADRALQTELGGKVEWSTLQRCVNAVHETTKRLALWALIWQPRPEADTAEQWERLWMEAAQPLMELRQIALALDGPAAHLCEKQSSEATPGKHGEGEERRPDGPFDADGFRFAGVPVRFGRAGKQYALVMALWDAKQNRPTAPRPIEVVISEVWGNENETEESTFRQLCADVRRRFQAANCPLTIQQMKGIVQLAPL